MLREADRSQTILWENIHSIAGQLYLTVLDVLTEILYSRVKRLAILITGEVNAVVHPPTPSEYTDRENHKQTKSALIYSIEPNLTAENNMRY